MKIDELEEEFRSANRGDKQRGDQLERTGMTLARKSGLSFPEAMVFQKQLEDLYRFRNNEAVDFEGVHRPHAEMTAQRCRESEQV